MSEARCLIPRREVVAREVDGERVLLNLRNGNRYRLDQVGASVWEQLETGRTLEWLAGFVSGKFQMDPDRGMSDLILFTKELSEHGLIEVLP